MVCTAVSALCRPEVNLAGAQATTGPVAPLTIVHGEAVDRLGFNCGHGTFGPGWVANASVGRAVKLVLLNVGGARSGDASMTTLGQPGQYGMCIAENTPESPWESYPASLGLDAASAITVYLSESVHNAQDHSSDRPAGVLQSIASDVQPHIFRQFDKLVDLVPDTLLHAAIELIGNVGISGLRQADRFDQAIEQAAQAPDFVVPLRLCRIEAQQHHVDVGQDLVHALFEIPSRVEEQDRHSRFFFDEAHDLPKVLSDEGLPAGKRRGDEALLLGL
jgi:hypothetical protein